jgi:hypothetical protein
LAGPGRARTQVRHRDRLGPVDLHNDLRVREHLAVVRFTINRMYLAAINVNDDDSHDGDWYTTICQDVEQNLPFGDRAEWSSITRYGEYIQVVTEWAQLI